MAGWLSSGSAPSNVADAAAANLGPLNDDPAFLDNALTATGEGLMKGGALAAQTLMLAGSVVPRVADALLADDNFSGQSLTSQYFAALDETVTDAVNYWTPDVRTTGAAGRVLSGIAEFGVPMMLSGGNPLAMAALTSAQATTATGADLARAGATAEQAGGVAAVQGAANLIGFGIATRGATALRRAASGAAGNLAVNVPADAASAAILDGTRLEGRYDPMNAEARIVDVVVGALFGAMSRGEPVKARDLDAALTVNQVKHAQDDLAPGILETPAAARAQMDNLNDAQRALIDGSDMPEPRPVAFKPDPVREADAAAAVRATDELIDGLRADMADAEVPATPTIQNRDRGRAASIAQMQEIAKAPDYGRLGPSRSPESGAPMVFVKGDIAESIRAYGNADFVTMGDGRRIQTKYAVVSADDVLASHRADGTEVKEFASAAAGSIVALNNGRTAGVQAAYVGGHADAYLKELTADAASHGIGGESIEKINNPMLVRVYSEKDNTANIGDLSNARQGIEMSPTEKAQNDARLLGHLDDMSVGSDGGFSFSANRALITRFLKELPKEEAAGLQQADGSPSKQLIDRLQAAVFQMAYKNQELTSLMSEATDPEIANIIKSLMIAAPRFARIGDSVPVRIPQFISDAAQTIRQARASGLKVREYLAQGDIFSRDRTADSLALFLGENNRSVKRMGDALGRLAEYLEDEVRAAGSIDMFGDARDPASLAAAIEYANKHLKEEYGNDAGIKQQAVADLFGANPAKLANASQQRASGGVDGRLSDAGRKPVEYKGAEAQISGDPDVRAAYQAAEDYPDMPVALVDDPDVPEGVRRLTARDALDELKAETARDAELAKGYEAAINCFLRGV